MDIVDEVRGYLGLDTTAFYLQLMFGMPITLDPDDVLFLFLSMLCVFMMSVELFKVFFISVTCRETSSGPISWLASVPLR